MHYYYYYFSREGLRMHALISYLLVSLIALSEFADYLNNFPNVPNVDYLNNFPMLPSHI